MRKNKQIMLFLFSSLIISNFLAVSIISSIYIPPPPQYNYKITCYGYVKDLNTGNVISGVTIKLKELETGISSTVTTGTNGYYYVTITTPSYYRYTLTASKSGLQTLSTSYYSPGTYSYLFEMYPIGANLITCYGNVINKVTEIGITGAIVSITEINMDFSKSVTTNSFGYYYNKYYSTSDTTLYRIEILSSGYDKQIEYVSTIGTYNLDFKLTYEMFELEILNIGSEVTTDYIMKGTILEIIARCSGWYELYFSIDDGPAIRMTRWGNSDFFFGDWDTSSTQIGFHYIRVYVNITEGLENYVYVCQDTIIYLTETYQMTLYYEIDYIEDYEPQQSVLDYWVNYWNVRAIDLNYVIDQEIAKDSESIKMDSQDEILYYENIYNNHYFASEGTIDDRAYGNMNNSVNYSQEKWILWGADWWNAGGSGQCYTERDVYNVLAGNYIFISSVRCSDYNTEFGAANFGAHIMTLMHETGHSIGIAVIDSSGEQYDPDSYSVMSYPNIQNCCFTNHWYYSWYYWSTRNDYY